MKLFLVIASVATMCLVECSSQDLLGNSYVGGYNVGGLTGYAVPSYGVPSYGGLPGYGTVPTSAAVPTYGAVTSYGGSTGYGGLSSFGLSGMSRGSDTGSGLLCQCAPAPPKICGSDFVTYLGWCNFKCAAFKTELKVAYLGECRLGRNDSQRDNDS